jgi:hypothetical protein
MLGKTVGGSMRKLAVVGAVAVLSTVGGSLFAGAPAGAAAATGKVAGGDHE